MNLTLLHGTLSSAPELRTLASGDVLAQLQVTTRSDDATRSVPVSLLDPPNWVEGLGVGDAVVVLGSVHRRFFRAGGATASRTEVVAARVQRGRDRRARERFAAAVRTELEVFVAADPAHG